MMGIYSESPLIDSTSWSHSLDGGFTLQQKSILWGGAGGWVDELGTIHNTHFTSRGRATNAASQLFISPSIFAAQCRVLLGAWVEIKFFRNAHKFWVSALPRVVTDAKDHPVEGDEDLGATGWYWMLLMTKRRAPSKHTKRESDISTPTHAPLGDGFLLLFYLHSLHDHNTIG